MEAFYDKTYNDYEVFTIPDFIGKKVINLIYDINYDLIYIFLAKVKQIKGKKLTQFHSEYKNMQSHKLVQYQNCGDVPITEF